jgi:type II secretory pathway pseudopilin PulG
MQKKILKEKKSFIKWGILRFLNSAIRNPHSAIGKGGFTLIEIIILIVMAGILLPVIIVPFVTGVKSSGKPEMATKAIYLAHQRMEEFTKFHYDNAAINPVALTAYAAIPGNSGYEWQWEIALVNDAFSASVPDVGYKRILVRVKDPQNDTYEIYSVVTRFP